VSCATLYTTALNENAAKPTGNSATRQPGSASGTISCGRPRTSIENQMTRAEPRNRLILPDSTPPATPPRLPTAISSPVSAGLTCRIRTRKMICSAAAMAPNRFAVPVHAAMLRRIGCLSTNFRPSEISARSVWCGPGGGGRSRALMASRDATETA
jgi:hypothetical protein